MKKINTIALCLIFLAMATGCEVIGDIFGAGVYTGIFIVVAVIIMIVVLAAKVFKK